MKRLVFAGGRLPTREELVGDELITQMLKEAEEKGKNEGLKEAEKIIQSFTVEDIEKMLQAKKGNPSLMQVIYNQLRGEY